MSKKPPTQRVSVQGIDSFQGMKLTPGQMPPAVTLIAILQAGSKDLGFQSFVLQLTGAPGPATPACCVEAVFKHIGATCWADLKNEGPAEALAAVFTAYSNYHTQGQAHG